MAYADVLHPMVVSVTKNATFSIDNYLRRMLIVSNGGTSLASGEYKIIDSSNYLDYVRSNTETEKQVISFFSYAGSKSCVLLEVGEDLSSGVNNLRSFLTSEELKVFNVLIPDSWFFIKQSDKTYSAFMESVVLKPTVKEQKLNIGFVGTFSLYANVPEILEINFNNLTYKLKGDELVSNVEVILKTSINGVEYEVGKLVFNTEESGEISSLNFSETIAGVEDNSFLKLAQEYDNIDKENMFFLTLPKLSDVNTDANFKKFEGMKSIHLVSDNTAKTATNSAAVVMGITASSIFDISTSTPASSLNYKQVKSYTPLTRSAQYKNSLIQSAVTLIDILAGNSVLLNGRQLDGQPWDYYYYWYLTKFKVNEKITTLLLSGSNNPVSAVGFDQDGIDTIHANIVSILSELQGLGVITTFAQAYDSGTGEFLGKGDIVCPNYYKFIASNPQDYANEVLTGVSCFIQIGKFIRQVQWNVTLGA